MRKRNYRHIGENIGRAVRHAICSGDIGEVGRAVGDGVQELTNDVNRTLRDLQNVSRQYYGQTNVNLDNHLTVFDISQLKGNLKPFGMFIVIDYLMWQIRSDRTVNKALLIDELWQLISENVSAAEYVKQIWKTIRGYGGAAIGATQDINDYFALEDGKYGKAIISASAIKILKKTAPIEAKAVRDVLDLTAAEYKQIMRLGQSQGLICADNVRMTVDFIATSFERWNITTHKDDLARLKEVGYDELVG